LLLRWNFKGILAIGKDAKKCCKYRFSVFGSHTVVNKDLRFTPPKQERDRISRQGLPAPDSDVILMEHASWQLGLLMDSGEISGLPARTIERLKELTVERYAPNQQKLDALIKLAKDNWQIVSS
jgi:hypothetical protein